MITIYFDMDGVLCNFDKAYRVYDPKKEDRKRFRTAVMEYKIFEDLEKMSDCDELIAYSHRLVREGCRVEILTSMGTHDPIQGAEAQRQKILWLRKHGILYKTNFSKDKVGKSKFARPDSILIDDSIGCITPFENKGGHGILHTNAQKTITECNNAILQIRALNAVRFAHDGFI